MQYILDGSIAPSTLQEIAITMRARMGSARDAHVSLPVPSRNSHLDPVRGQPCSSISGNITTAAGPRVQVLPCLSQMLSTITTGACWKAHCQLTRSGVSGGACLQLSRASLLQLRSRRRDSPPVTVGGE